MKAIKRYVDVLKYGDMELTVETITPGIAKEMLKLNTGNRNFRPRTAEAYARDMASGNWVRKPLAVCFDKEGHLGNGQHTLCAITLSGVAQEMLVARNVDRESIAKIDAGLRRTLSDIATFLGQSFDSRTAAIARVLGFGATDQEQRSFDEVFEIYQRHSDYIDYVQQLCPKAMGFSAAPAAVFVRALYSHDQQKVERFIELVKTGVVDGPHESAAIVFRDHVRANPVKLRAERLDIYQKTESALLNFLKGRPLKKLYAMTAEQFPLPEEQPAEIKQAA